MSVVIKTSEMQYRDGSGNYHGINAIAEKKIADQEAALDAKIASTQAAVDSLESQKNTIAATIASMAQLGTDTTLTTPGQAADAKAAGDKLAEQKSAIELEDDKTNELFGYVNYGYNETAELEINTAYHKYRIGIKRNMTTMLLNGTTTTEPCYVKITNTLDRSATASGITAFTEPIKLIIGHTYKVISRLLHGSYSENGGANITPPMRVAKHGASANQGSGVRSEDGLEYTRTFTAVATSGDEALYHIMFAVAESTVVDNALVNVTVEDMTNMSIVAKAISAYNMAGSSLLLPFEYAVDINATEENPADFNDYATPGNYRVLSMSVMSHISHSPSTVGGRLIVMTTNGATYLLQIYIADVASGYYIYKRTKNGSNNDWSEWHRFLTTQDEFAQAMAEEGDEWSD